MRKDPNPDFPRPYGHPSTEVGGPFRRLLVPIEPTAATGALSHGARMSQSARGSLRLVHVRVWDPVPWGNGRVYSETSAYATAVIDAAVTYAWARGVDASGVVLEAPRSQLAATILNEVADWGADVIVLGLRAQRFYPRTAYERAYRQLMRASSCPVLVVYPNQE